MLNIKSKLRPIYYKLKNLKYQIKYIGSKQLKIEPRSILLVTNDFEKQGAPVLLLNIAKWLKEHGYGVVIIGCKYGPMIGNFQEYATVIIKRKSRLYQEFLILSKNYECHDAICNTVVSGQFVKPLKETGYHVVSLIHELYQLICALKQENNCYLIAKYADSIVFPSHYGLDAFKKVTGSCLNEGRISIRNQGLFNTDDRNIDRGIMRKNIEERYNLHLFGRFVVINVATACMRKGFDLFLDLAISLKDDDRFFFIWVGDKTEKFIPKKLENFKVNHLDNCFFPGYINNINVLNDFYGAADILALTSREEPFGSIVLEAFKAGTPVIAFEDCGGYMDVVKEDQTGYLVKAFDVDEMKQKLLNIIDDSGKHMSIARNCKTEVSKHSFDEYCRFLLKLM